MELTFTASQQIFTGNNPNAVHFANNSVWGFRVEGGRLTGSELEMEAGDVDWSSLAFSDFAIITKDEEISLVRLKNVPRLGVYGVWHQAAITDVNPERHRFAIWTGGFDPSDYLIEGSLSFRNDTPIAQLTLSFENPDGLFVGEDESLIHPGAEIELEFHAGDSDAYPMGKYFIDSSKTTVPSSSCNVAGRNMIGKMLKDQTFDANKDYPSSPLSTTITSMLNNAGLSSSEYVVQATPGYEVGMEFPRTMSYFDGILEILKTSLNWIITERTDGKIVIGSTVSFTSELPANSRYTFNRGTEVFSRSITRDDVNSYNNVCVYMTYLDPVTEEELEMAVYSTITNADENWNIPPSKTLYVQVPSDTPEQEMLDLAGDLAERLSTAGSIETFVTPFRPQLIIGDEAEIISDAGTKLLGTITDINHRFGKGGYYTEFTVDSGGRIGKPMLKDYINQVNKQGSSEKKVKRL